MARTTRGLGKLGQGRKKDSNPRQLVSTSWRKGHGAAQGIRTLDLRITNALLYQLS
jgi:hypothetical protein